MIRRQPFRRMPDNGATTEAQRKVTETLTKRTARKVAKSQGGLCIACGRMLGKAYAITSDPTGKMYAVCIPCPNMPRSIMEPAVRSEMKNAK